jgi:nucleoside-diphosphate-sugar epimerase
MRRVLLTGGSGFLGRHVLAALRRGPADVEVLAVGRRPPLHQEADRFRALDLLSETSALARLLDAFRPDVVLHLAGRTPPAQAAVLERENVALVEAVLGPLADRQRPCRVVLAGSAAEYGPVPDEHTPVREDFPGRPADAYGRGKKLATERALQLARGTALRVAVARVFNLIGPDMPASQAFGRFAASLAGPGPDPLRLTVGDLRPRRDFVDVRDAVQAVLALASGDARHAVYNVATGESRSIGEGLERLIALSGRRVVLEVDPDLLRRPGPLDSRGDPRRLRAELGWRPTIAFEASLADLWHAARDPADRRLDVA